MTEKTFKTKLRAFQSIIEKERKDEDDDNVNLRDLREERKDEDEDEDTTNQKDLKEDLKKSISQNTAGVINNNPEEMKEIIAGLRKRKLTKDGVSIEKAININNQHSLAK